MTTGSLWAEKPNAAAPPPRTRQSRRWPYALIAAALLFGGLYAWLRPGASSDGILHVGSQRGGTKALMIASGALKGAPYTVDWSEFPAAQNLQEAIGADLTAGFPTETEALFQFAYQSGQPIKAIAALAVHPRPPGALAILVPENSPIHDVAGLKGKKIATTRGSIGHYLILRVLEANGLKPDEVKITFLSPGDTKAAFDTGSIDAWAAWSPYVPTALAAGARIVADGASLFNAYAFDVANAGSVQEKRAYLADFVKREAQAYVWAKTHPRDYAQVLARDTGMPFDIALYHVEHQPLARVSIDDALKAEERGVVTRFRKAGALAGDRPLDQAYEPLDQGASRGG